MPPLIKTEPKTCLHCGQIFERGRSATGRREGITDWNVRKFCSRDCYVSWHVGENHHAFLPGGSVRKDGYIRVSRAGKRGYLHREVAGAGAGQVVHHKDENPSNNAPSNLVITTPGEHMARYHADRLRALAAAQRGVPITEEHRKNISLGSKGKKKSSAHAAKIKAGLLAFHVAKRATHT